MSEVQRRAWWQSDDSGEENTPAGKLKKYKLSRKPPIYSWYLIKTRSVSRVFAQSVCTGHASICTT